MVWGSLRRSVLQLLWKIWTLCETNTPTSRRMGWNVIRAHFTDLPWSQSSCGFSGKRGLQCGCQSESRLLAYLCQDIIDEAEKTADESTTKLLKEASPVVTILEFLLLIYIDQKQSYRYCYHSNQHNYLTGINSITISTCRRLSAVLAVGSFLVLQA